MNDILPYLTTAYAWALAHPEYSGPALVLVLMTIYSYVPRTPPKNPTLLLLWGVLERLTFLSWERWGGNLKAFGVVSPNPDEWASEKPTVKDAPALPPKAK